MLVKFVKIVKFTDLRIVKLKLLISLTPAICAVKLLSRTEEGIEVRLEPQGEITT